MFEDLLKMIMGGGQNGLTAGAGNPGAAYALANAPGQQTQNPSAPLGFMPQAQGNDAYYWNRFNTPLDPTQEDQFQQWMANQSLKQGRDLSNDLGNYDLRGFWAGQGNADPNTGHMPDTFKKPNHPTFSNQSINNTSVTPGGEWGQQGGKDFFRPTQFNLSQMPAQQMQQYFRQNEPNVNLMLPQMAGQMQGQNQAQVNNIRKLMMLKQLLGR